MRFKFPDELVHQTTWVDWMQNIIDEYDGIDQSPKSTQSQKGSTFDEILEKYRNETNPVTRASYRDIMITRLKQHQQNGGDLE